MFPEIRFVWLGVQVLVSVHGLSIVCGVVAGGVLVLRRAREPEVALLAVACVAVGALAGAHGLFVAFHGGEKTVWTGGLASTGGIAGGLLATWLVARVARGSAAEMLDVIVPAGLLALGIGRIGCFLGGCCYGAPTTLPWGVVFPEVGLPARHPLQLYSAVADFALLIALPRRAEVPGAIACRGCVGFGLVRTWLETLRDPATTDFIVRGRVTVPQVAALLLASGALCLRHWGPSIMPPARRNVLHGR